MLHSKRCVTIAKALEFVNDNQNKIIPVSFVNIVSSDEIIVVYEAVDIPEPGTTQIDLLNEAKEVLKNIIKNEFIVNRFDEVAVAELYNKLISC